MRSGALHLHHSHLSIRSDIHLFKENLKPMWEEEGNRLGGKWILRLKKGLSTRLWELLVFAVIGEQFSVGKEICGIVCSIRPQEDLISVWTKTANNQLVTQRIKETMKKVLNLPPECKRSRVVREHLFILIPSTCRSPRVQDAQRLAS